MLSVREIQAGDMDLIAAYWLRADSTFLTGMGVDLGKLPGREQWITMLSEQLSQPCRALAKLGFELVRQHVTTPGWINFEQPVNLWELPYGRYESMPLPDQRK